MPTLQLLMLFDFLIGSIFTHSKISRQTYIASDTRLISILLLVILSKINH